jgi:uncharacterized membrane protein YGL010W
MLDTNLKQQLNTYLQYIVNPIEISVSMVAVPCLRFAQAALWKGHAPHTITGAAKASEAHCQ